MDEQFLLLMLQKSLSRNPDLEIPPTKRVCFNAFFLYLLFGWSEFHHPTVTVRFTVVVGCFVFRQWLIFFVGYSPSNKVFYGSVYDISPKNPNPSLEKGLILIWKYCG